MKVTLGGDRLGSGNKNKLALRNYERSTFNLSQKFTSSMQVGALYPFLVIPAMRGDTFEIDLQADGRTIPTKAPLFGSFKMQVDVFQCPVRLYQAILHNNPTAIGLKMAQVKLPQLIVSTGHEAKDLNSGQFSNSCLLKYLGVSGIGQPTNSQSASEFGRAFNAVPALAYYDIFKTYYANKQEKNAYVITGDVKPVITDLTIKTLDTERGTIHNAQNKTFSRQEIATLGGNREKIELIYDTSDFIGLGTDILEQLSVQWNGETSNVNKFDEINSDVPGTFFVAQRDNKTIRVYCDTSLFLSFMELDNTLENFKFLGTFADEEAIKQLQLLPFDLKNIDDMRMAILSWNNLGTPFKIGEVDTDTAGHQWWTNVSGEDQTGQPYTSLFARSENQDDGTYKGFTLNKCELNGLVVKTYQSDLFNNWVKTEWIDGENGIAAVTAISTASGSFTMDALNLAEKLYNMLNRVAVADGTYEGWQDAVYTQSPRRHIESPVYLGGMSSEIMFEEIVQTASEGEENPLGKLAGKGRIIKRKGGKVVVKVDEASFIIGIVSITPRVNYAQGNEFYMTDLESMDDFHKPALDGIGFENLIGERLCWADTIITANTNAIRSRSTIGKVPAWVNYMTAVDKCYGDFASADAEGFNMNLVRIYDRSKTTGALSDVTTYIDPRKYNYVFAYSDLASQNFWVQIYSDIKARRLMSAKQIPNL